MSLGGFDRGSSLELDQSEGHEDLQLQVLGELIVHHSDESSADLDDLFLQHLRRGEVQNILEAESCISPDLDRTMHNGFFEHCDQCRDTTSRAEHAKRLDTLLVEVVEWVVLSVLLFVGYS